jgi:hypothetical protein
MERESVGYLYDVISFKLTAADDTNKKPSPKPVNKITKPYE